MNNYESLLVGVENNVCTITLNRPGQLNAMNRQLIDDMALAFEQANEDSTIRAIILTGAGRAFCAGDDRNEHVHPRSEDEARNLVDAIQRVTLAMVFGSKPIVGAINGWAVGGGLEWAINCDFPIWANSARGFFPEVSLNLFVTGGVSALLPAMAGLHHAREMLYFGERYTAQQMFDMGVAWRVVDDERLADEAHTVASRLADLPELSSTTMKQVLSRTTGSDIKEAIRLETEATVAGFMDPETTRRLKNF